ncbi:nitronate monooxygenase [Flavobacterium sp. Sd200]|uniref:NAD(P)H-dependent flavin oxidoreductase n=1 Tax=Flavobacterium sp. Sd200 TaxID=2692211 RepID=UPI001367DE83|nr:nitronate monooxygenase [Flavobacterium sp. Sd200]MXN90715.1 nitronate monooxygenase [Flavobacterium sp. Sd200]
MGTELLQKLGCNYPVIQAPMFGVTTPQMVAAAGMAGCLGSAALGDIGYEKTVQILRDCKKICREPFAANIFVNHIPPITEDLRTRYNVTKNILYNLAEELKIEVDLPEIDSTKPAGYTEQIDAVIAEGIKVLSFTFGNLDTVSVNKLKSNRVVLIGTCTSEQEAQQLLDADIDIICVQGIEAGGHRGSFTDENMPKIGGISLLQNIREMTTRPVVYAGGIASRKAIEAVKLLGADGFQVGTVLICSEESALTTAEKQWLASIDEADIILTKSFSGRYARGVKNAFIDLFENSDYILPYPYQNKLTGPFRSAARKAGITEYVNLWTGQTFRNLSFESTEKILRNLVG